MTYYYWRTYIFMAKYRRDIEIDNCMDAQRSQKDNIIDKINKIW